MERKATDLLESTSFGRKLLSVGEPALTIGTSLASEPLAGLYGLAKGGDGDAVEHLHHATTYMPRTESGSAGLAAVGQGLSDLGGMAMDLPYIGAGIQNFDRSRDALIESGHPALAAALTTAPAAVAMMFPGGEGAKAATSITGDIGKAVASGGNMARIGPVAQGGFINPSVLKSIPQKAFKFSRSTEAATAGLVGERTAERVGRGLERTHKAYVSEKTATQDEKNHNGGRNLFAAH